MNTVVSTINHHRSLATEITSQYGREIWNHVRLLEKLRVKIMKRAEDLNLLKTCRDKNLTYLFSSLTLHDYSANYPDDGSCFGFETSIYNYEYCGFSDSCYKGHLCFSNNCIVNS